MSEIDPGIFKAYDVRGLYPDQMDEDVAYRLGRAFAQVLADEEGRPASDLRVGLGRDMRLTAPALAARYADGLRDEGASVLDVGQVGTEMLYFAVGSRGLDGGLMCTASHNPKAYTGAKLVKRGAIALSGDSGIAELKRIATAGEPGPPAEQRGDYGDEDISAEFREAAAKFIDLERVNGMKVVLDGGNGMAGPMVGPLLDRLPVEQVQTYWSPDGNFPDHEPNPLLPENRQFIIDKVLAEGAELGIAWDGDADRCFFIDDRGRFVDGDFLTALLAESIIAKEPGAAILYDVRASRAVADVVERAGGSAHVNRVGHAFFKTRMRDEGAELGIAWDGDADRCFFIDDKGRFVDGDFLTALLAESIIAKEPGAAILYDVRASRAVADVVERAGGTAHVNRVGHAFFKTRMRDEGAAFGGEVSGHYYFRDFYCADSGTIPALLVLELLSAKGQRMSELLAEFHSRYFISGEINSEVEDQDGKMNELAERYSDGEVSWLDGVSVDYEDWHFNVRPSNTEPLLRLNLESLVSQEHMEEKRDEVLGLIRSA